MATNLGEAILVACWDQGWAISRNERGTIRILRPVYSEAYDGDILVNVADVDPMVFDKPEYSAELWVLLDHLRDHGLRWPWPPIPHPRNPAQGFG